MSDEAEGKPAKVGKVTLRETPTAEVVREALKETTITDGKGRRIKLVRPGVLSQYRLVRLVGGEASANNTYMQMLFPLLYVAAIDDIPVFFPASQDEIDALILRLDEEGIAAIVKGVTEKFGQADLQEERDAIKN